MKTVVIIPWRDVSGSVDRLANVDYVMRDLANRGWDVRVVMDGRKGPFNRSAAYNQGRAAYPADVYVWHEADMVVPQDQLELAVETAAKDVGLVIPFVEYLAFNKTTSQRILDGESPAGLRPMRRMPNGWAVGAVGVTSEATMRSVGRWDEGFSGWGFDDNAMFKAFQVCAGEPRWVQGVGYHLWHPAGVDKVASRANEARWATYRAADTADEIRALCGAV